MNPEKNNSNLIILRIKDVNEILAKPVFVKIRLSFKILYTTFLIKTLQDNFNIS